MVKINTLAGLLCAWLALTGGAVSASAQSAFHFPRVADPSSTSTVTLTNPSSFPAEVELELFGLDGQLAAPAANPIRYELEPRSVLSMTLGDLFVASGVAGWVHMTSQSAGLTAAVTGASLARPMTDQVVIIPDGFGRSAGQLRIVNSSDGLTAVNVSLFDGQGTVLASSAATLAANAGADLDLTAAREGTDGSITARVLSTRPILAQAALGPPDDAVLVDGQPGSGVDASFRIAPYAVVGGGFRSILFLSNPTGAPLDVAATLFSETGGAVNASQTSPYLLSIPPHGIRSVDIAGFPGADVGATLRGWIEIESIDTALAGFLVVSDGVNDTLHRLQTEPATSLVLAKGADERVASMHLVLTNAMAVSAEVEILGIDAKGNTLAQASIFVGGRSQETARIEDLFPRLDFDRVGFFTLRASGPVYGVGIARDADGAEIDGFEAADVNVALKPQALLSQPTIISVDPQSAEPGGRLQVVARRLDSAARLMIGSDVVNVEPQTLLGVTVFNATLPVGTPGFIEVRVRSGEGRTSDPRTILVLPPGSPAVREVKGRAFYEKLDVGSEGLELERRVVVPVREALVEVVNRANGAVFSMARTDGRGEFRAMVPLGTGYSVRTVSRSLGSESFAVRDNTSGGTPYFISADVDGVSSVVLLASDSSRTSGAFNILEVVRQANAFLKRMDQTLSPPNLDIFWSPLNTAVSGSPGQGQIGGTFFSAANNTAFVLGDRAADSDEFDDDVILHEYAHLIAARISRDDSIGGAHVLGDVLDPRVAWSEGWANFFSGLVRGDSKYRDSLGPGGSEVHEHDLEENIPFGDQPGYRSEFSVHSILWDLLDGIPDLGDTAEIPLDSIWQAFTGLRNDGFVYVVPFLDRLVALEPGKAFDIEQTARTRSIDYVASTEPSVSHAFPQRINGTEPVTGEVDSLSRRRANLAQSAHHYAFDVNGGAVSLRLDITGTGAGGNSKANDLDLFLMDSTGRVLARSDRGLNGQSELISTFLPAGRYVVEIRSFYTQGQTGTLIFNSGSYRLQLLLP